MSSKKPSDQELVAEVMGGCTRSYTELCERHTEPLRQVLMARCNNAEVRQDVLQDTLVRAYLKLHTYDPQWPFGGWITTIAKNLLVDHSRRLGKLPVGEVDTGNVAWEGRNPEESFIEQERGAKMLKTLRRMSPDYGRILDMRFLQDMSYSDIAQELGLPLGTVKTQIHRARHEFMRIYF